MPAPGHEFAWVDAVDELGPAVPQSGHYADHFIECGELDRRSLERTAQKTTPHNLIHRHGHLGAVWGPMGVPLPS